MLKRKPDVKVYALVGLPMYQVLSQATSLFYDLSLYDDIADIIVTSSSVGSRYRKNPQLFAAQLAFYADLDKRYEKLREFGPADGSGPRITIYHNPRLTVPFATRTAVPPLPPPPVIKDLLPGSIGGYFDRMGYNFEAYGFYASGLTTYGLGLRYTDQPEEIRRSLRFTAEPHQRLLRIRVAR